jgi:2OG-Fe(II) oxygenase superfamily
LIGSALQPPFLIDAMATSLKGDAAGFRAVFDEKPALLLEDAIATPLLQSLLQRAAEAPFIDNDVRNIGTRQVESPQRVGKIINLLFERSNFLKWLEAATGIDPLRAAAGRLVQTRANRQDALEWHDDGGDDKRKLGVVLNLSDKVFEGGAFEMRRVGEDVPFLCYRHVRPGSLMFFAVRSDLEHRVTQLVSGGPRRVYAGWIMSEPED